MCKKKDRNSSRPNTAASTPGPAAFWPKYAARTAAGAEVGISPTSLAEGHVERLIYPVESEPSSNSQLILLPLAVLPCCPVGPIAGVRWAPPACAFVAYNGLV